MKLLSWVLLLGLAILVLAGFLLTAPEHDAQANIQPALAAYPAPNPSIVPQAYLPVALSRFDDVPTPTPTPTPTPRPTSTPGAYPGPG